MSFICCSFQSLAPRSELGTVYQVLSKKRLCFVIFPSEIQIYTRCCNLIHQCERSHFLCWWHFKETSWVQFHYKRTKHNNQSIIMSRGTKLDMNNVHFIIFAGKLCFGALSTITRLWLWWGIPCNVVHVLVQAHKVNNPIIYDKHYLCLCN